MVKRHSKADSQNPAPARSWDRSRLAGKSLQSQFAPAIVPGRVDLSRPTETGLLAGVAARSHRVSHRDTPPTTNPWEWSPSGQPVPTAAASSMRQERAQEQPDGYSAVRPCSRSRQESMQGSSQRKRVSTPPPPLLTLLIRILLERSIFPLAWRFRILLLRRQWTFGRSLRLREIHYLAVFQRIGRVDDNLISG